MNIFEGFEFKYPPNQALSQKHRLATKIWRGITNSEKEYEICDCCGRKTGEQIVEAKCINNSSSFSFLGPGIPLYFKFLKYSLLTLVFLCLIFSIFGLYSNIVSNNCQHDPDCVQSFINKMSIINKKDQFEYLRIQNYILLSFVVFCIFMLQFYRYRFRKVEQRIDTLNISASDYSIILKRLPPDVNVQDVTQMIQNGIKMQNIANKGLEMQIKQPKIQSIVISYDLTQFISQKQRLMDEFKKNATKNNSQIITQIDLPRPNNSAQIAVVVFEDHNEKQYFIHQPNLFQKLFNYFFQPFSPLSRHAVKKQKISIQRAPQPEDIFWQNAHITPYQRLKRKIILNSISFILLMVGGACQYGLAVWQSQTKDPDTQIYVRAAASVVVTITNQILQYFLIYSTKWQKMSTQTQYLDVLTSKLIFQQFLNAGIFVLGANILAQGNNSFLQRNLADIITQIMILNALTTNVSTLIMNRLEIVGRIKRYLFIQKQLIFNSQLEANKLYQLPKPDFTSKYSYIVKTLWLTAFYAPLVPVVVPISVIGLAINYVVEKYLFSAFYSVSSKISSTLNNSCIQGLQFIPLIISSGQLLIFIYLSQFIQQIPKDWFTPIYVSLGLSFVNLILPMKQFNQEIQKSIKKCLNNIAIIQEKIDQSQIRETYQNAKQKFQITYEMTNPAYQAIREKRKDTATQMQARKMVQTIAGMKFFGIFEGSNSKKQQSKIHNQCILKQDQFNKQGSDIFLEMNLKKTRQQDCNKQDDQSGSNQTSIIRLSTLVQVKAKVFRKQTGQQKSTQYGQNYSNFQFQYTNPFLGFQQSKNQVISGQQYTIDHPKPYIQLQARSEQNQCMEKLLQLHQQNKRVKQLLFIQEQFQDGDQDQIQDN